MLGDGSSREGSTTPIAVALTLAVQISVPDERYLLAR